MITLIYRVCGLDHYKIRILSPYAHHTIIWTDSGLLSTFSGIYDKGQILRMTGKFEYRNDLFYHRLRQKQEQTLNIPLEIDNPHAYIHFKSL